MNHIGLFEGIGGFSLAAEKMGWNTIAWCEWNEFCQDQLKNHLPNAKGHGDIRTTDFTIYRGQCDVLTGGFPCQPYSTAGKRLGKEDERHLWPEMLRAIREIAPLWVVGENVRGLLSWNGGMVFDEVQADLEACGYEVLPFVLPACGVNAPHRRDRIWFVAYRNGGTKGSPGEGSWPDRKRSGDVNEQEERREQAEPCLGRGDVLLDPENPNSDGCLFGESEQEGTKVWEQRNTSSGSGERVCGEQVAGASANTKNQRQQSSGKTRSGGHGFENDNRPIASNTTIIGLRGESDRNGEPGQLNKKSTGNYWSDFPTVSPLRDGNDGLPTELLRQRIREDSLGYLSEEEIDKILSEAGNKWAAETIKAGGNAIVPQVALQILKAIEQYEKAD